MRLVEIGREKHAGAILEIFNHAIANSTSTWRSTSCP